MEDSSVSSFRKLRESLNMQTKMNLYSNHLYGVVLMVSNSFGFHENFKTKFFKACESSTELHFPDLRSQLKKIKSYFSKGRATDLVENPNAALLKLGDVYITRHSNLCQVHVVFHLTADDDLYTSDINSRHPCIISLHSIVRTCYRYGITVFTLPLLLVEKLQEEHTIPWCLRRAELVFKCVKGFMMESAQLSVDQEQYTVQFFLPPEISSECFRSISEMVPTVFHMANPVVMNGQKKLP